jgi:pimeloyl-ACP methyl ester carboxylesterase
MTILDLPDGRRLDFEVSGPQGGVPLVMHHGTPGSLVQFPEAQIAAQARGLRLVTYSRPGYGASTRQPGRTVADAAQDVAALLDYLDAPRCVTVGWSGGGPHALATAARLPGRVAAVATVAGVGPYDGPGLDFTAGMGRGNIEEFELALAGEDALRATLTTEAQALRDADAAQLVEGMADVLSEVDRATLASGGGSQISASFAEGLRLGPDGWIDDDLAFIRPWGFALDEITVPAFIWQGGEDLMVPFAHGGWLAGSIPGAVAHLEPKQGHLSLFLDGADRILDDLVAAL